jgi:hypothetical protein
MSFKISLEFLPGNWPYASNFRSVPIAAFIFLEGYVGLRAPPVDTEYLTPTGFRSPNSQAVSKLLCRL